MIEEIKKQLEKQKKPILGQEDMNHYAVMIPLIEKDQTINILFEKRSHTLRRQPGEISFPGGKIENIDPTPMDTAIRETTEELGISKSQIEVIHEMDTYVHSHNMIIYPFVAHLHTSQFQLNPDEVGEAFCIPIDFFFENPPEKYTIQLKVEPEESFPFQHIPGGKNYAWRHGYVVELFYLYDNYVIWGMTARILYHFIEKIKMTSKSF